MRTKPQANQDIKHLINGARARRAEQDAGFIALDREVQQAAWTRCFGAEFAEQLGAEFRAGCWDGERLTSAGVRIDGLTIEVRSVGGSRWWARLGDSGECIELSMDDSDERRRDALLLAVGKLAGYAGGQE